MKAETRQSYKERILRVLVHIQGHLDEVMPLDKLARVAHFSPYHFHRIFRGMVGESVKQHVRRLRLERTAHYLKFTEQPVTRIAFDAGYETHESFTRAFREMFDEPPSRFRRIHQALPYPKSPSGVHYVSGGSLDDFSPVRTEGRPLDVHIEAVEPMRVAFTRHIGPYGEVEATWKALMAWAGRRGLLGPGRTALGIVHDDPEVTPPERIRYDACVVVDEGFEGEGDVGLQQVSGGEYAVATHRGHYARLSETYTILCGQWLPGSGRQARWAPALEIYRNSLRDTAPEELLTDIWVPVEPS